MVINLGFLPEGEIFVQPAEMSTPIRPQNPAFGGFGRAKSAIFAFLFVSFCFFAYEYTKTAKIPFVRVAFEAVESEGGRIDGGVSEQSKTKNDRNRQGGFGRDVSRRNCYRMSRKNAIYYIKGIYRVRTPLLPRRPARRRDANGADRQKPSPWLRSGCT